MIAGIGLHIVVALFFAVHAMRTGQQMYWLFILLAFPGLGSVVYFFAIYLPHSRLQRGATRAVRSVVRAIDPTREVREAQAAFDDTPTAQNQMRLAAALLDVGQPHEAAKQYEACLKGPFAQDVEVRFGAGRTFVECGRDAEALAMLQALRADRPDYRAEEVSLLLGRALSALGRADEARAELEAAVARHGSYAAKAELAIWAHAHQQPELAARLGTELAAIAKRWSRTTRELNAAAFERLKAAERAAQQRAG
ncbi:MAG: hypothetical protein Q4G71_11475 [Pseudomonadota bacterium]|nr:hypothetical protein [Pseudomonadota bacterium]